MNNERLNNELYNKLEKELNNFKEEILKLNKEEIYDNAYEIIVKKEFLDMICGKNNYTRGELKALLNESNILQKLYNEWLKSDGGIDEILKDNTDDFINEITESFENNLMKNNKNANLIETLCDTLNELNIYGYCDRLKQRYDMSEYERFEPIIVQDIINLKQESNYLIGFFDGIKESEELNNLVENNICNQNSYYNISNIIISELKNIAKKEQELNKKSKDLER